MSLLAAASAVIARRRSAAPATFDVLASAPVFWYDPSDAATRYQGDRTTLGTADGDRVGKLLDKSGHGYHATGIYPGYGPFGRVESGEMCLEFIGDYTNAFMFPVYGLMRNVGHASVFMVIGPAGDLSSGSTSQIFQIVDSSSVSRLQLFRRWGGGARVYSGRGSNNYAWTYVSSIKHAALVRGDFADGTFANKSRAEGGYSYGSTYSDGPGNSSNVDSGSYGFIIGGDTGGAHGAFRLYEMIGYDRNVDSSEETQILDYLQARWGLSA